MPSDQDSLRRRAEKACGEFEAAWKAGRRPRIEDYLADTSGPVRSLFLKELVALEIRLRRTDGEVPALEDYLSRFPGESELLVSLFTGDPSATLTHVTPGQSEGARPPRAESGPPTEQALPETEPSSENVPASTGTSHQVPPTELDPAAVQTRPALVIPGFEIQGVLGHGGMGIVYKARQLSLKREVVLKVLPPAFATDRVRLHRFQNEATIAAGLSHSRIVPVYEILYTAGTPAILMPYIDGCNLDKIIVDRKNTLRGGQGTPRHASSTLDPGSYLKFMLSLLDQLVDGVATVHEAKVLHRDIKPSNILVDSHSQVRVTDFGLARLGTEAQITEPGVGFGTPGFMSPEQWEGHEDIDARADVFSLGATMYYALTLELPYGKKRVTRLSPAPVRPGKREKLLSADFDAVLLKALEIDRNHRYRSACELRDDWRRVRSGLIPLARQVHPAQKVGRWLRRHPRELLSTGLVGLCLGILAFSMLGQPEPVFDSLHRRLVTVETEPAGTRFAVVPLNRFTGEPEGARKIEGRATPEKLRLPPGDYLVVVEWDDGQFHEVYRHVPELGEMHVPFRHHGWKEDDAHRVTWRAIEKPPANVLNNMVLFQANPDQPFPLPDDALTGLRLRPATVGSFYLDRTEVTNSTYLLFQPGLPVRPASDQSGQPPGALEAVRYIDFALALHVAEQMGKRLPLDIEYLLAATHAGTWRYPWGNAEPTSWKEAATFGPVGSFALDRTTDDPPVLGLFSNVGEWTLTRPSAEVEVDVSQDHLTEDGFRVVRGAPPSVVEGKPVLDEYRLGPAARVLVPVTGGFKKGLGFRCARSAAPRFLTRSSAGRGSRK